MKPDCKLILQQLDSLLEGSLDRSDGEDLLRHLERCDSCAGAFGRMQASIGLCPGEENQESLTAAVLQATTGSACESARRLLCGELDGTLEEIEKRVLEAHLAHCAGCGEFRDLFREMGELLPGMAEMDPGEAFAGAVLARSSAVAPRPGRLDRWVARATEWIRRPQFDWEASYVGSLVLFLLLGTAPIAGPARQGLEHSEALRVEWSALAEETSHWVPQQLRSDTIELLKQGERFYAQVRDTAEAAPETIESHARKMIAALDAAVSKSREAISARWQKLTAS